MSTEVAYRETIRRFVKILTSLVLLVLFSTVGIKLIEGWSWLDSLWHTVITISTVGYGEVKPLSQLGKLFTMAVIVVAFATFAYGASSVAAMVFEGELKKV